jgi:endonuclease/exonuclease/phosphatase family metal-dependent hydrolase
MQVTGFGLNRTLTPVRFRGNPQEPALKPVPLRPAAPPDGDLLVQTFNMLLFNTDNPHTTPPEKQAAIARLLKTPVGLENPRLPDILLLQEVHSKRMLEKFLQDQGLREAYPNVAFFDPWQMDDRESTAKAGQAIVTRSGIQIEASRRLSDGNSPKPVGEAVLNIDGQRRLYAYTVHTRYTPWHPDPKIARRAYQLAASIRLGQIEHLRDRIREIVQEDPGADVIVAGDFNATGTREPARFARVLGQAGLRRVDPPVAERSQGGPLPEAGFHLLPGRGRPAGHERSRHSGPSGRQPVQLHHSAQGPPGGTGRFGSLSALGALPPAARCGT